MKKYDVRLKAMDGNEIVVKDVIGLNSDFGMLAMTFEDDSVEFFTNYTILNVVEKTKEEIVLDKLKEVKAAVEDYTVESLHDEDVYRIEYLELIEFQDSLNKTIENFEGMIKNEKVQNDC